ncbi:hypothetical protein VP395_02975 [Mariniflexile soesokkakense]|uniref:Uncharacterized protein n=1 Tax=Mariniflexile soesokkakense TaxID=1343160 RepID=A0ABV0A9V6_9FLAO
MIGFLIRKVFCKNLASELTEIKLTENGFSISEPFEANTKSFHWNEIKDVRFSENNKEVIIEKSYKKIILKKNNIGWYDFIQNVPSNFTDFDFDYIKDLMDSLKPCEVCGIVAVRENECIVCETIAWNNEMTESKIEYLKLKQSEFYSDQIKNRKEIKKVAEPEHGFKADKNWKLHI